MNPALATLDYRNDRRRPRRWRRVRRFAAATLVLVAAWYSVTQVPGLVRQIRCSRYSLPPETVVYDDDPVEAVRLESLPNYMGTPQAAHGGPFIDMSPPPAGRVSPSLFPVGAYDGREVATVFLHTRRTAVGDNERIVIVFVRPMAVLDGYELWLCASSFVPRSVLPCNEMDGCGGNYAFHVPHGRRVRIFAGQADPRDPTHFAFDYEFGGVRDTIDGWLTDDADTGGSGILLKPRGSVVTLKRR
jgi:hypothetical protein